MNNTNQNLERISLPWSDQILTSPINHHHSDEPQPLTPPRKKVSFRHRSSANQENDQSDVTAPSKQLMSQMIGTNQMQNGTGTPKPKKKSRPKHFYESPRVYIRAIFMKVGEIDTVKEMYEADIFIQARWREPTLDALAHKKHKIVWSEVWNPGLIIENQIKTDSEKVWNDVIMTPSGEAYAIEKRRVKGKFAENMELENFPFDTQGLSLVLTSEQSEVEFVEDMSEPSLVNHLTFVDAQEWIIRDLVECVPTVTSGEFGNVRPTNAMLLVRIHATRKSGFFKWNVLAIMILICSLALCTFSINRGHPSNRLQLTFTLVLTAVAFKFASNQSLPKISYLTMLDKYILVSMILMHVVCVWHSCICLADSSSTTADTLDIIAFFVFVFVFLLFQIIFIIVVNVKIRGKRAYLLQLEKQYQEKVNKVMGPGYMEKKKQDEQRRRQNQIDSSRNSTFGRF